jgi:alpha-methylacyl-CoA racemase
MNMVGDYGGGGMFLAFGVVCALLEAKTSGAGQVVDAAMVDGAAYLMGAIWGLREQGTFTETRGTNLLDTGAPFYDVYETADGEWVSVGPIEPQFYQQLLEHLDLPVADFTPQMDQNHWPALRAALTELYKTRTRDDWITRLEGTDVCFAPVLKMSEALRHPHLVARETFVEYEGVEQPAPAPRFSRTHPAIQGSARMPGADTDAVLSDWGFTGDEIAALAATGAIKQAD